jgi:hypothetical protein
MKKLYERIAAEFTKVSLPATPSGNFLRDDGTWQTASGGSLPSGLIVMWSGLRANIPGGWYLCDGTNGTPDLRARFILSVTGSEEAGGTGGSTTITHSGTAVAQHPATATSQASAGVTKSGSTTSTVTLLAHTHDTPVLTHSVTQPNDHTNVQPPYYKLCFIMKG